MPQKTRAELEGERDELRGALEAILDRVTNVLGDDEDDDDDEAYDEDDD
jgi:hypothetical protein